MHEIPEFTELLTLLDERSTAFHTAIQSAPDLSAPVPTCPDWTLLELAQHLGSVQRRWALVIAAGPSETDPTEPEKEIRKTAPSEREALLAWLTEATRLLLDAGREAGPERGCWAWWGSSEAPLTAGAVIRHQVQEVAVHTYDAQLAAGVSEPEQVPGLVAIDGVEEFGLTCGTTNVPWPYEPALFDVCIADGPSWRVTLSPAGASLSQLSDDDTDREAPGASLRGTANNLVLALYERIPLDSVTADGDLELLERVLTWDMEP
ncbi:maleylpyruvate isomerase N-terminal domain-containing protein [Catenulispora sp. NF23]|uniref:Maleylpyruvate isomerase N-terminal domain-containing protein n=1 Tax=Catenulispora pinistramenti TaxID=2705254 RepID=A0ABS5L462_9ACTN|nr:maleylpyruvate isomerase family mycothiol-dependent enzyme [Catenulispora pinistramenti]MBS2536744.1 maleylpyruvate isomerase N-terminal domain-containing protein [Catenulispora pinistramenti]MBS2553152.1 maleylpyruvate isomerase N-terminal domain-containing protein [Catenulispora pinistramenti]